jgi:hypothetical protein
MRFFLILMLFTFPVIASTELEVLLKNLSKIDLSVLNEETKAEFKDVIELATEVAGEEFSAPLIESETDTPESRDLDDLSPGPYYIKVKFIDRWGRASRFSPPQSFEVIKEQEPSENNPGHFPKSKNNISAELSYIPNLTLN